MGLIEVLRHGFKHRGVQFSVCYFAPESTLNELAVNNYKKNMHAAVVTAFNQLIAQKDEFLPGMKLAMERAMLTSNSPRVKEIDERLEALQKELLKKANAKQGFEELADEIDSLREEKQDLLVEEANRAGMKQRLDELEAFLTEQTTEVTEYDEGLVRQLIEKITVYDDPCL